MTSRQCSQEAAYNGPGACCSLALFTLPDGASKEDRQRLLQRAAHLMQLVEANDEDGPLFRPANLQILVAVSARLLGEQATRTEFREFPAEGLGDRPQMRRGEGQADILVQIAAPTEADRRYALRLASEVIGLGYGTQVEPKIRIEQREVHGARIFSGLEPFGYRDGPPAGSEAFPPELVAAIEGLKKDEVPEDKWIESLRERKLLGKEPLKSQEKVLKVLQRIAKQPRILADSSDKQGRRNADAKEKINQTLALEAEAPVWLLYQRYVHNLAGFSADEAKAAIGKEPFELKELHPPAGSHLAVAKEDAALLTRRGFAYRTDRGEEGLAFIALARDPVIFREALKRHLESDRLLTITKAVDGGIYVVPPSADSLMKRLGMAARAFVRDEERDPVPPIARQLLRPSASPIPALVDYQVAAKLPDYVSLIRSKGIFLEPTMHLRGDIEALLVKIEDALEVGGELRALREEIRATSEAVYQLNGGYLVLGA